MVSPEITFSPTRCERSSIRVRRPASAHFFAATGPPKPGPHDDDVVFLHITLPWCPEAKVSCALTQMPGPRFQTM